MAKSTTKHTPTSGMKAAAKRGIEMMRNGGWESDIPDISIKGGGMLSAGRSISDDHVRSMAQYHAGHYGNCPAGGDHEHADDLMWGGPAGAQWSSSRVAAMEATHLSQSPTQDVDKLLAESDCSLEIFTRDGLIDRTDLKKDENGLIWAPIIRSGTLAVRPGPNGTKVHEPLTFVAGHASNETEIGLEDLVAAFKDTAVEHVTIPKTHANDTFENTGKIVDMRIADSTLRPGEKVILAAHKFTEPDVEGQVERGSVLSRSCGILHKYTNTETGKLYPHVIEHVALTNRAWVPGMEPYGSDVFSQDREVVGLMLSERQIVPPPAESGQHPTIFSTSTSREQLERELHLADVQWGDEPSLSSIQTQLYDVFRDMGRSPDYEEGSIWFSVRDVTPTKALVSVDYGGADPEDAWVIPFSLDAEGKLTLSDFSEWTPVEQQWVTDEDAAQDKQEVQEILQGNDSTILSLEGNLMLSEADLNLATLTAAARKKLNPSDFVFPKERGYPIHDLAHARNALSRGAQNETGARLAAIRSAVYKRYPQLKKSTSGDGDKKSNMAHTNLPSDPLKRASVLRLEQPNQRTGGHMPLNADLLARLDLSDEAREVLQREVDEGARRDSELAKYRKETKETGVTSRLTKLSEMGFKDCPGFLRTVEDILRSDDGDVAIRLNLSQEGTTEHQTVTQIVDRIIEALPKTDKGTIALSQKASLLESPLSGRPNLEPEKETTDEPMTGDALLAKWREAEPSLQLALPSAGKE